LKGFLLPDIFAYDFLASVQVNRAGAGAYVPIVGVGHFAWAVDDAAHNGDFEAFEVACTSPDAGRDFFQVEEGASTRRASDVIRAHNA